MGTLQKPAKKVKKLVDKSKKNYQILFNDTLGQKKVSQKMKIFQHIGSYNQLCVNNLNADSVNTYFVNVGKNPSSVLPTHVELLDVLIALRRVNLKTLWV